MKRYTVFTDETSNGFTKNFEVKAENIDDAWLKAVKDNPFSYRDGKVTNVMLHFSESPSRVHISEAVGVDVEVNIGKWIKDKRKVCPNCAEHEQGQPQDVHDCKVIFIDDNGETVGQCECWSREHGVRGD